MVKNGHDLLGNWALKSAVSQEWFSDLSLIFACCCKFRKPKSYCNSYCVSVIKYGHGLLDHETLKYALSQE